MITFTLFTIVTALLCLCLTFNGLSFIKLREFYVKFQGFQQQHEQNQATTVQQNTLWLDNLNELKLLLQKNTHELTQALQKQAHQQQLVTEKQQTENIKHIQDCILTQMRDVRQQITQTLDQQSKTVNSQIEKLTHDNNQRLREINQKVEQRLVEGFEKTTATFADILKRLALIDAAQQKITELSSNVVSLQEVLSDKRSRGAFGEVQLSALVKNILPETNCQFQYTFSNGKRADCVLFLPPPTGTVAIDAKFPLESFRAMHNLAPTDANRKKLEQQFRQDVKKHIHDIADKYILAEETADGAMMFIPAEAIFADIHAYYPDLVSLAQQRHVWMVSPTTMMAIITTAKAVLKDADTREQVHIIQEHLAHLAKDFSRFEKRMNNLARHIEQANNDVKDVATSAKKITSRFQKIEQVEFKPEETSPEKLSAVELQDAQ